jgi:hypothetical protein
MTSNNIPNTPAFGGAYVPYFYQAGLYLRYSTPPAPSRKRSIEYTVSSYDFTSDLTGPRPYASQQSVEEIIARGYLAVPKGDPAMAMIGDKKHTAWLGLDDMIHQIRQRYEIYHRNMDELDQAVCEAHNGLFRQMADHGMNVANQRQMYSVDKQTQKIYEMQREERINLWRDVSRIKLGLPESAQLYLTAYRKAALLTDTEGDAQ